MNEDERVARQLKRFGLIDKVLYSQSEGELVADTVQCEKLGPLVKVMMFRTSGGQWLSFYSDPIGTEILVREWATYEEAEAFAQRHVVKLGEYDITHTIRGRQ